MALDGEYKDDLNSAINLWLFVNFIAGNDNTGKNYYMALKKSNGSDDWVAVYCPWDMDLSYGNIWDSNEKWNIGKYSHTVENPLLAYDETTFDELNNINAYYIRKAKEQYEMLRNDLWSDQSLNKRIDELDDDIFNSGAYLRDIERWPDSICQANESGLSVFREYVLARAAWMDDYISGLNG